MPKWFYTGFIFDVGPYRGASPDAVADSIGDVIAAKAKAAKMKQDEARKDFVQNLKPW